MPNIELWPHLWWYSDVLGWQPRSGTMSDTLWTLSRCEEQLQKDQQQSEYLLRQLEKEQAEIVQLHEIAAAAQRRQEELSCRQEC
jgi:hypothetical protein